jgi:hypothetical protein
MPTRKAFPLSLCLARARESKEATRLKQCRPEKNISTILSNNYYYYSIFLSTIQKKMKKLFLILGMTLMTFVSFSRAAVIDDAVAWAYTKKLTIYP